MRAPQPLHATPHGCGLIAVLLVVLIALLTGCAPDEVQSRNTLDEGQRVFVSNECWGEGFDATAIHTAGGGAILICTAPVAACAAP